MEESIIVMRYPKTFYFYFFWPKDDKNLKHEIEFIIKNNKSSAGKKNKKRTWTIIVQI